MCIRDSSKKHRARAELEPSLRLDLSLTNGQRSSFTLKWNRCMLFHLWKKHCNSTFPVPFFRIWKLILLCLLSRDYLSLNDIILQYLLRIIVLLTGSINIWWSIFDRNTFCVGHSRSFCQKRSRKICNKSSNCGHMYVLNNNKNNNGIAALSKFTFERQFIVIFVIVKHNWKIHMLRVFDRLRTRFSEFGIPWVC